MNFKKNARLIVKLTESEGFKVKEQDTLTKQAGRLRRKPESPWTKPNNNSSSSSTFMYN